MRGPAGEVTHNTSEAASATAVAERLRSDVAEAALAHAASPVRVLTVSIGVATAAPLPGDPPRGLISAADRALYRAKQLGRNRVERASEGEHVPLATAAAKTLFAERPESACRPAPTSPHL